MKLIFMDCDGCLNRANDNCSPHRYIYNDRFSDIVRAGGKDYEMTYVDPELAKRLSKTIEDYDLYIVASTDWRLYYSQEDFKELLKLRFLPGDRLIGYTPNLYKDSTFLGGGFIPRCMEIKAFLDNFDKPVEKVVIIDDLSEAAPRGQIKNARFFQCSPDKGYTEKIDKQVRKWLEERRKK